MSLQKVISGGQTGVDRAALDAAIEADVEHGGWCPKGRKAEDGPIPERYRLREIESPRYEARTEQNVIDSDATLILARGTLTGGTELTRELAAKWSKACLVVDLTEPTDTRAARDWLTEHRVKVLNVAGPRERSAPGIAAAAKEYLRRLFDDTQ